MRFSMETRRGAQCGAQYQVQTLWDSQARYSEGQKDRREQSLERRSGWGTQRQEYSHVNLSVPIYISLTFLLLNIVFILIFEIPTLYIQNIFTPSPPLTLPVLPPTTSSPVLSQFLLIYSERGGIHWSLVNISGAAPLNKLTLLPPYAINYQQLLSQECRPMSPLLSMWKCCLA